MRVKIIILTLAGVAAASAFNVNDWLAVNGSNQATFLRQKENGKRWTWDILQTEVWAWRFAVGAEAEFNHPRRLPYAAAGVPDPEGEKLVQRYARYRDEIFDARVGTFDKTLGKGLTLRSYADRDFGVEQRLDGAALDVCGKFGGREWGNLTALWGRNVRDEIRQPNKDWMGGGQLLLRPVDFAYATGSAVRGKVEDFSNALAPEMRDEKLFGAGAGGGWRYFDVYGEYATRRGYDFITFDDTGGHGFYGVATGYLPRSSVSVEYKRYDNLSYPYNNAPPASYDNQMITGGVAGSAGEWGYFAQATANPVDDLRVRGGYSYADDKVGAQADKTADIVEGFGTARYDFAWPVVVEAGYKHIGVVHYLPTAKTGDLRRTPMLKVSYTPWDDHSFFSEVEREKRADYTSGHDYIDNRASGGYTYASWLGLTVSYEDSSQLVQEVVDRGDPGAGVLPTYRYKHNWLWGEVRLSWYHPLLQNHVLTLGYGSQRGGLVCSSGVCRQQEPFNGVKVGLESTF